MISFENSPLRSSDFEKLPKEILPIILGQLSFADLIVVANVCRKFMKISRPLLAKHVEYFISLSQFPTPHYLSIIFGLTPRNIFARSMTYLDFPEEMFQNESICAKRILQSGDHSREEYIWRFVIDLYPESCCFRIDDIVREIVMGILPLNIRPFMKIYYFRKFYTGSWGLRESRIETIIFLIKKHIWRRGNLLLLGKLAQIILAANDVREEAFAKLSLPQSEYGGNHDPLYFRTIYKVYDECRKKINRQNLIKNNEYY